MRARINNQGELAGLPTPSQERLMASPAFLLSIQLYKVSLKNGHQTASNRLNLINQNMENAADEDSVLAIESGYSIACK